ncbi:MAG: aldehyde dehydrogenase family protein [Gammaproteobacteria bacterium]|nr:aldehyde dehydrogenase family protein [Gammaproteobacteria bacterium]MDE0367056.1 aldehyde dehydrogenase family protein [Gammaproteobacteria bacterium]
MNELTPGATLLSPEGNALTVDAGLAAAYRRGDRLVANPVAGLMHIPAAEMAASRVAVEAALQAFASMHDVPDEAIVDFYGHAAAALEDKSLWAEIVAVNAEDVVSARGRGRSTTRLAVSDAMRDRMIEGLRGWAGTPSRRGSVLETVEHDGFRVEMVAAALGVVAFVFEGRPNVLADACGVLRGGNTVVFRIGGDALRTARAIMQLVIDPALAAAGLPAGSLALVDSTAHAAGWALFLDERLSLAVARGSGTAVETLGSLARSAGTPVSLHGTGGAWMVVSEQADVEELRAAVIRSLDRKVCNTLNTCCVVNPEGDSLERVKAVLEGLEQAGRARGQPFKLHITSESQHIVSNELFCNRIEVVRAAGPVVEPQAEVMDAQQLGNEWEWEETPEVSLTGVDSIDEAVRLFNDLSPRLVGTLVSGDAAEQERFFARLDAPFVGDGHTRWVDGQFALNKPELGLSNWQNGRLFGRGGVLTGDSVYTIRTRYRSAT